MVFGHVLTEFGPQKQGYFFTQQISQNFARLMPTFWGPKSVKTCDRSILGSTVLCTSNKPVNFRMSKN